MKIKSDEFTQDGKTYYHAWVEGRVGDTFKYLKCSSCSRLDALEGLRHTLHDLTALTAAAIVEVGRPESW